MFSDFARDFARKFQNAQGVQIGRALNFGQIGDIITVQLEGQNTTKQFRAATPVNSHSVIVMGDAVFCESAPRVLRTETKEFLKVRPKPEGLILPKIGNVKWLVLTTESTNLHAYIGGSFPQERVFTLPLPSGTELKPSFSQTYTTAPFYFNFSLDNSGNKKDDWVAMYGYAEPLGGGVFNITLYRRTKNQVESYSETITGAFPSESTSSYNYKTTGGAGLWLAFITVTTSIENSESYTVSKLIDGSSVLRSVTSFDANGTKSGSVNTLKSESRPINDGIYQHSTVRFRWSRSGDIAYEEISVLEPIVGYRGGYDALNFTGGVTRHGANVNEPLDSSNFNPLCLIPYSILAGVDVTVTPAGIYTVYPYPVLGVSFLSDPTILMEGAGKIAYIYRWNTTVVFTGSVKPFNYDGFIAQPGETIVSHRSATADGQLQIYYFVG